MFTVNAMDENLNKAFSIAETLFDIIIHVLDETCSGGRPDAVKGSRQKRKRKSD